MVPASIVEELLAKAVEAKVLRSNRVRADTTIVEANVGIRRTRRWSPRA